MYVKITTTDQDLESFCYLPLKSGEVYEAKHSTIDDVEYNTFFDVIFNDEITVRGMHESTEIELVENAFYVKTGIQVNPGLVGGYIDYAGAIGFNLTSGIFENIRYYGGIRLGTIIRNGNGYPLFGYETGFNVDITDKIFIGLRSTYDYRSDNEFWGTDAEYKFNGSIRIGKRF